MSIDDQFEKIVSTLSGRKQKSLKIIHEICQEQVERGSKDFSVATIGLLSEKRGGPVTQTIRNKTGEEYRAVIELWKKECGADDVVPGQGVTGSWTDQIKEPDHKFLAKDLELKVKRLQQENTMLRANANPIIDMRPKTSPSKNVQKVELNDSERKALKHAISEEVFEHYGWSKGEKGQVFDERDKVIFKPGYVTAIEKILSE